MRRSLPEMLAAERHPHDTLAVDVGAARSKAGEWDDCGTRRAPFGRVRAGRRHPCRRRRRRCPHRTVHRAMHDSRTHREACPSCGSTGWRRARRRRPACRCRRCRGPARSSPAFFAASPSRRTPWCRAADDRRRRSSTICRPCRNRTADDGAEAEHRRSVRLIVRLWVEIRAAGGSALAERCCARGWSEPLRNAGLSRPRTDAVNHTRPFRSTIMLGLLTRVPDPRSSQQADGITGTQGHAAWPLPSDSGIPWSRTGALKLVTVFVTGSRIGSSSVEYSGEP